MSLLILAIAYPAAIALLFYFAFLRPVQQERARQRRELAELQVGDEVLTQGGLIAMVKEIRVPEERAPTELILDLGGLEGRAHASAIARKLGRGGDGGHRRGKQPPVGARARDRSRGGEGAVGEDRPTGVPQARHGGRDQQ